MDSVEYQKPQLVQAGRAIAAIEAATGKMFAQTDGPNLSDDAYQSDE